MSARYGILFAMLFGVAGCAIPREHSSFAVSSSEGDTYLSSERLLTAGLVNESLEFGTKGRTFDAEARLRRALVLDPENPAIKFNLAAVLAQAGHYEEAEAIVAELRRARPDAPNLLFLGADIKNSQRQLGEARELLKQAFLIYKNAGNTAQAASIARSISNLAFADGAEQEALCYSFEAFTLTPTSQQLGYHGSVLVGLNLFRSADEFISASVKQNAALGASVSVHLALALAKVGLGDLKAAVAEAEIAQDLIVENPELGNEVNVVWWLLRGRVPSEGEPDPDLPEKLETLYPDVERLRERPTYALVRWPPALRAMLEESRAHSES